MNRYIALEGIDGAGKTSVQAALGKRLQSAGFEVVTVREPGGTLLGESLRAALLDGPLVVPWAEVFMFAADRAQLMEEVVRPALGRGAWVVSDRSVYSSLAYQGAGRGLGVDAVRRVNEPGLAGTWPDRVVLLDVPPRTGLTRQRRADRIGASDAGFLSTVAQSFESLARREPDRFVRVDAERPLEVVVSDVWAAVRSAS